jgi:hypothetical protein
MFAPNRIDLDILSMLYISLDILQNFHTRSMNTNLPGSRTVTI